VTKPESGANKPPAAPAQAADTAKATVFTTSGWKPSDSAAVSLSRTARIAAPQVPRDSQRIGREQHAGRATASIAMTALAAAKAEAPPARRCP
jgi:hypothetical protein